MSKKGSTVKVASLSVTTPEATASTAMADNTTGTMPTSPTSVAASQVNSGDLKPQGIRKNGKNWHTERRAFRPAATSNATTSFHKRRQIEKSQSAVRAIEKEMKDDKEAERKAHVERILGRRKEKEEKERQRILEEKMGVRRRERLKRKEKRNKLLNS